MPHVSIKTYPLSEEVKQQLSEEITKIIIKIADKSDAAISIAITDIPESEWMEKVYEPEIKPNLETLYKKPGY
ncbi:tautomerase family protein [Galbibacter sp. BG1]